METKLTETQEHIRQYKAEINRKLTNKGFPSTIGFTCKKGVGYSIYWINSESVVTNTLHTSNSAKELLLAIQIIYKTIHATMECEIFTFKSKFGTYKNTVPTNCDLHFEFCKMLNVEIRVNQLMVA